MEHLEKIIEMVDAELGAIANNGKFKSKDEIMAVGELIDMTKDVYCIWGMEEDGGMYEDDMSYADGSYRDGRGGSYRGGSYRDGGSYRGGMSYARGRGRNAKRDSMGRYSREGSYRGGSYRYSRGDGKAEYIESLRDMMEDAPDDQTRQSIQRMIAQMEQQ